MKTLEFHPLANLFPLIKGDEFERLADDIATNGLNDEIILYQGKILDGRNRYRALLARGASFPGVSTSDYSDEFENEAQALAWVLSKNLHRRHLTSGQRALIAANIATMKSGARTDLNQVSVEKQPAANLREDEKPAPQEVSISEAAEKLQVSPRSVDSAKKVLTHGAAELADAVRDGKLAVSAAADIAELPMDEQVKAIASADPKAFAKVVKARRAEKTADKKAKRTAREKQLGEKQRALPNKKFGVIYADPEWKFEPYSDKTGMDRAADNHYPTSAIEAIKARPVGDIAADDCVLFLWATVPMLEHALDVLNEWGFYYRSQFIWHKPKAGTGYWNRNAHEILLVGTRGNVPCPAPGTQWPSVIEAPVEGHSEKPEIFHFLIESYFPNLPKIELNARKNRPGWTIWGLEADEEDLSGLALLDNPGLQSRPVVASPDSSFVPPLVTSLPSPASPDSSFVPPSAPTEPSPASPPMGTKAKAKRAGEIAPPIVARVNIDNLELLVRVADKTISFYATQPDLLFPAEAGSVSAKYLDHVTAKNIGATSKKIWLQEFAGKATASILNQEWRMPTTTYRMGRTGPMPVKEGAK